MYNLSGTYRNSRPSSYTVLLYVLGKTTFLKPSASVDYLEGTDGMRPSFNKNLLMLASSSSNLRAVCRTNSRRRTAQEAEINIHHNLAVDEHWHAPPSDSYKINFDGAFLDHRMAGAAVLRDEHGRYQGALSSCLDGRSSLEDEGLGLSVLTLKPV